MSNPKFRLWMPGSLILGAMLLLTACFEDNDDNNTTGPGGDVEFTQVDRMGIPTLNTVFNHPPAFSKQEYNTSVPSNDSANYYTRFVTVLTAVANDQPEATASLLLPDMLPYTLGSEQAEFSMLNGRRLSDDAVDVALSVVVGSTLSQLHSDNVDSNDKAFLEVFPYLATPH